MQISRHEHADEPIDLWLSPRFSAYTYLYHWSPPPWNLEQTSYGDLHKPEWLFHRIESMSLSVLSLLFTSRALSYIRRHIPTFRGPAWTDVMTQCIPFPIYQERKQTNPISLPSMEHDPVHANPVKVSIISYSKIYELQNRSSEISVYSIWFHTYVVPAPSIQMRSESD